MVELDVLLGEQLNIIVLRDLQHLQEVADWHVYIPNRQIANVVKCGPQLIQTPIDHVLVFLVLQKYLDQVFQGVLGNAFVQLLKLS